MSGQKIGCKPDILTAYCPLTVTLFRPALEPGLHCVLACYPSALLAIRCLQPDRQFGLVQHINHPASFALFLAATHLRLLFCKVSKLFLQVRVQRKHAVSSISGGIFKISGWVPSL